ncbi:MAG: patatin-like phospholipase family protein [Pseudomonadota bacterium]
MELSHKTGKIKTALVLSGGGARAAYQVGVLKAVADILPKDISNPFPIICGTSAGAINATALAVYAHHFREAVWRLTHVWHNFRVHEVFRADTWGLARAGLHWFATLALGGLGKYNPSALLDRAPLHKLLSHYLDFDRIQTSIDAGLVEALSVSASSYTTGHAIAFYQGVAKLEPWSRMRRMGVATQLTMTHLMASSAIPFVFAPEKVGNEYFGDGSMRQTAPISPALHLGAERLFVVGVKNETNGNGGDEVPEFPSLAQIAGHVLNSIFLDNVDADLERLCRINRTLNSLPPDLRKASNLRVIDVLTIAPSRDLDLMAARHVHLMPAPIRFLMRGLGVSPHSGSSLLSYVLFERAYCRELINLGYQDAMLKREQIVEFFDVRRPADQLTGDCAKQA